MQVFAKAIAATSDISLIMSEVAQLEDTPTRDEANGTVRRPGQLDQQTVACIFESSKRDGVCVAAAAPDCYHRVARRGLVAYRPADRPWS
jgi:hypothetical protein